MVQFCIKYTYQVATYVYGQDMRQYLRQIVPKGIQSIRKQLVEV